MNQYSDFFKSFDQVIEKHELKKVKTIGDSYMAVGGIPEGKSGHPISVCMAGMDIVDKDLSIFGYVSEKAYENSCHWLMFLFDCHKIISDFFSIFPCPRKKILSEKFLKFLKINFLRVSYHGDHIHIQPIKFFSIYQSWLKFGILSVRRWINLTNPFLPRRRGEHSTVLQPRLPGST